MAAVVEPGAQVMVPMTGTTEHDDSMLWCYCDATKTLPWRQWWLSGVRVASCWPPPTMTVAVSGRQFASQTVWRCASRRFRKRLEHRGRPSQSPQGDLDGAGAPACEMHGERRPLSTDRHVTSNPEC